jgi:hypothetical protein
MSRRDRVAFSIRWEKSNEESCRIRPWMLLAAGSGSTRPRRFLEGCQMSTTKSRISRRRLLKQGAAAAAASAALGTAGGAAFAQAPAVVTRRSFRAWISRGTGRGRTTLQDVRLRPVTGRQVVVRTEACNLCYSNVGAVLGLQPAPPPSAATAASVGLAGANLNDMAAWVSSKR